MERSRAHARRSDLQLAGVETFVDGGLIDVHRGG